MINLMPDAHPTMRSNHFSSFFNGSWAIQFRWSAADTASCTINGSPSFTKHTGYTPPCAASCTSHDCDFASEYTTHASVSFAW
jgi:hypothetical protein